MSKLVSGCFRRCCLLSVSAIGLAFIVAPTTGFEDSEHHRYGVVVGRCTEGLAQRFTALLFPLFLCLSVLGLAVLAAWCCLREPPKSKTC